MVTRAKMICLSAGVLAFLNSGCIVGGFAWFGPRVWTAEQTERFAIETDALKALDVTTHNGRIAFTGLPAGASDAYVVVTRKGGGVTFGAAEEALAAIDVFVESAGDGTQRIGWRWNGVRHAGWGARVHFDIHAPGNVNLTAKSHNGGIKISGSSAEVRAVTHNGRLTVASTGARLVAETHNGGINATFGGDDVTLITHNGSIVADLVGSSAPGGSITTHNGGVTAVLGPEASTTLRCRTGNGGIRCNVPLMSSEVSRHRLSGTIGSGEGRLGVTTHNGGIRIKTSG